MTCEFCEREIPAGLLICSHCGHPPRSKFERRRQTIGILVCIALFCAAMAIISIVNSATPHFQ